MLAISLNAVVHAANVSNQSAAPNPFNPNLGETTTISYDLANNSLFWLRIYDSGGTLQRNLVTPSRFSAANRTAAAGKTEVWNGRNNALAILPNGSYPYHIDAAFFVTNLYRFNSSEVHDVAVDPSNPNIIWSLIKSDNGSLYRSTNGGVTFSRVSGVGADDKASGIAVSDDGQRIYIANEGRSSLFRSTNGGSSWDSTANLPNNKVSDVAINSDGSIIYVSIADDSSRHVYKSINGGTSWSSCSLSGVNFSKKVSGVATDATGTTLLIVDSDNDRIARSLDGCATASYVPNIFSGSSAGRLSKPRQIELLGDGKFWVSDGDNQRIQQFDANGKVLMVYGSSNGDGGTGNYQFDFDKNHAGIDVVTIGDQSYIFVADFKNKRIKKIGFDNWVSSTDIVIADNSAPVGGYTTDDVIPAGQISQATDGSGVITINWKARDNDIDNVSLYSFQYSDDGGVSWYTPNNGAASAALSANWDDNGGGGWSTATTFAAAAAHSFSFNTQHADVTAVRSLDNLDQSDIQIRFRVNDGTIDSVNPTTSESVRVDNLAPNDTIVSAAYDAEIDTLVITGTNFTSIALASTDIKTDVDWSKFVWDINGDDAATANITFALGDVSSLTITNATTLTLVVTAAKGTAIEATAGFGAVGGADSLDVTAGFSVDTFGNAATTDGVSDGLLAITNNPPVGGYTADDVIPASQISQATDGSGVININWKARDNQSDNVSLNTFQYSDDGGASWYTPNNGDTSAALSVNWDDNGGGGWSTATTFGAATAHSFTFNTQHADVTAVQSLDNVDQSDIQIRFTVNDSSIGSVNPATSASVRVDNLAPNNTIVSTGYNSDADTLVITGTNFTSIAPAGTDIKGDVDWTKFVWDINGDNAITANISFVLGDVSSLTVTNATTLTLVVTAAKGTAIEATAGYGAAGGDDTLDIAAGFSIDAFGNVATTDGVNDAQINFAAPIGGYTVDNVIPSSQIPQATDGSGIITINWKARDNQLDNVSLNTFQYSDDGGLSWYTPNNGDTSAALSVNWDDNGGGGWSTATTFGAATVHSFTFNTQHADVTAVQSLDNVDQSDIQIRFTVNDGGTNSINPATSESVRVDNLAPNDTIVSAAYDADTDTLVITGTNFTSIAAAGTDIKGYVDWTKFVWDVNGDDAVTANITFAIGDVSSLTITNATTLTLVVTAAKGTAIEATAGYGSAGGADSLDVTAGFSIDAFGNAATIDGVSNGVLLVNSAPVGGYTADNVIPAGQISQATDGSGIITINWKARDDDSDNVNLHGFQYSDDGGASWYMPNNGDTSGALSVNWDDNGGGGWSTATTFAAATAHSFSFNTQHTDVTAVQSLDNVDQSDIQIRFTVNDSTIDSFTAVTSASIRVDNLAPNNTIVSSAYNADTNTLVITGANFTSNAPAGTDIKGYVDWSKFVWDVNGDDAVTANITFAIADVSSLTITNATTLTLVFTAAKGTAIEATAGYGAAGGADSLDVSAGFSLDEFGNAATTDGVSKGLLVASTSISGTVFTDDDEVTPLAGETVRLLINGVDSGLTDITDGDGNYRITSTPSPGDDLLVYIDSGGGNQGTTVTVTNGLSLTGVKIYQDHIVVRHDNSGVITNGVLSSAADGDADVQYAVVGGNLTVSGVNELYIPNGHSFVPGGNVTTPSMESRGSFDGGIYVIDINGALSITDGNFTSTSATMSVQGNYALTGGAFTHNGGTVVFDGGNQSLTGSTTFYNFSKTDSVNDASDVLLTFDNNATQTILGTLTLDGLDDDDRINLVSNNPGNQWSISLASTATKAIDFVDVTDSDASGSDGSQIPVSPASSVDSGNNIQWFGAVSAVLAEIDRVSIPVGSVSYDFNYDLLPTISTYETGINSIAITAPAGYTNLAVNTVYIGGVEQISNCLVPSANQYCAAIAGQVMTVTLGSKVTTTDTNIRVVFTADAPTEVGSGDFTATVDDTDTIQASAQLAIAGNADGDASDTNSQTVDAILFNGLDGSTIVADPLIVTADGVATSTLTATLLDNDNIAVPGKVVTFASDRDIVDTLSQPTALSDVDGIAVGSIRSTTPGVVTVSATDITDGITLSDQAQIYFSHGLVLELTKTASKDEVVVGDIVTYQIEIKNTSINDITPVVLEDTIPPNFKYLEGSARINGAPISDPSGNRQLLFDIGTVPALDDTNGNGKADQQEQGYLLLSYQLVVGAGATPGDYVNTVYARDVCDACLISNTASEVVEVVLDPFFDLGTIIGKVFNDKNEDGWQDNGEAGIAGAMVVLDDGTYVLTDSHGRFHFPAVRPGQRLLKINAHSLPSGSIFSTPIAQVLSVTPGLLVKANFGVRHPSELRKIGREGETSVNIARKEVSESTVDVYGSVAMQKLFVNGTEVPVAKVDVSMFTNTPAKDLLNFTDGTLNETVGFKPTTNRDQDKTKNWELQILTPEGDLVRSFKTDGILPASIPWDGLLEGGTPLEGGRVYHYQLSVEFWDGSRATSPRRLFSVNERSALGVNMTGDTFELGSITLSATAKESLKKVADALRRYPDGKIFIDGHTDSAGSSVRNMAISKARAEAAARYLVKNEEIPRARLDVRGFGETRPVVSNSAPEQRSLNRRIELHGNITKRALAKSYRRFTVEPTLTINGEKIEVDKYFSFRDTMVLAEAENLAIVMQDRFGRSSLTHLYAPKLLLPNQGEEESYRIVFPPKGDQSFGVAISEYHFEGTTVPGSVVEFDGEPVEVAEDGTFRHKIGLPAGKSTHNLIVTSSSGYTRFSSFELTAVNHDEAGRPLYLVEPVPFLELDVPHEGARVSSKLYTVSGKTDPKNAVFLNDEEIEVEIDGSFSHTLELNSGHNLIFVRAVNPEGFEGRVEHGVEASESELFLMAFADGKFGQLKAEGHLEGAGMQANKEYYNEGRVAYYLKGRIKGKYLITSAFDSGTQEINKLFKGLDEQDNSKLFTQLDPDKLYPVYGDSSTLVNDIESQGKFYLAVESDELNVVVGNYAIGFNDTELAGFQRTLYGAQASYQSLSSSMSGRPDTKVGVFGAQIKQAPVHDELQATGGSLYYLSHSDIIEGSDQVTLVVRDKDTGLTLSRTILHRDIDYRIYYDQGRLITTDPISSVVEDQSLFDSSILSGNPVTLELNYEAELNSFEKKVLGARVSKTLSKNIAIGATQVNDESSEGEYELSGMDAEIRFGQAVRVLAELAESNGINGQTYLSLDGGLTFNNVTPGGELNGNAWKATMELDVGELLGDPGKIFVDAYLKRLSDGFLSMGNFLERGTRKAGLNMLYSLNSQSKLLASYTTEKSDADISNPTAITETANLSLQWRYDADRWGVTTEYQGRENKEASGNELESNQYVTAQARYQLTEKVTTHLERQQTINGIENDQTSLGADYQITESTKMTGSVVQGTQGKAAKAGIQWLFDGGKLYLDERMTQNNVGQSSLNTVVGGESQLGSNTRVYSEYQIENADAGDKQVSLLGADRFWQLQKGLVFTLAGEHSLINGELSDNERYSLSTSLNYKGQSGLSWSTKNEFRRDQGDQELLQYLSNFLVEQQLNPDYTLLFKYQLSQTRNKKMDRIEADFNEHSIGLAYRPVASDRLNLLARYTGISDKRPLNLGQLDSQETQTDIFSIEWSFDLTRRLEWVDKLAIKVKTEESGGYAPFTSHTGLSIHRLNYQFAQAWDVGTEYRILAQREADDRRKGWLTEVMWRANDHMRLGVGYNFTDFSDNEYSDNNYSVKGAFVRLQGMY